MTLNAKGKTPEENETLNKLVQSRLGPLLQEMTQEAGVPPLAAILVVHWGAAGTSVSQVAAPMPKSNLFTILSTLSRSLVAHLESQRASMRTSKDPSAS